MKYANEKEIFVISDIHGHFTEMKKQLDKSDFDENNQNHLLIVCGDLFDRGEENVEIFEYLYHLTQVEKAVVIRGNHDSMLIDYLEWSNEPWNYMRNGTCETIDSFLGRTRAFGSFSEFIVEARKEINKRYPTLLPWLKSLPWYYETKNYIFTHAAIDTQALNWQLPHCIYHGKVDWDALSWDDGSFLGKRMLNTNNKTVVVGHFDTGHLRKKYDLGDENDHSILECKDLILPRQDGTNETIYGNKIFLDGCTILTKEINLLKINKEELVI